MDHILFGSAYYDEYMPYERLASDIALMRKADINTVRIAESTWSTCEPQPGEFDFSHVERAMDAMESAGMDVIIGTPTYAVPAWLVRMYPDVLVETATGRAAYGARQLVDITNPAYLFYGERVIRQLMEHTAHRKCVIGFQLDNETKHYGNMGLAVQQSFVKYLRRKFDDDLGALNRAFGLDYWSNRIDAWEDFPDVRGTVNASLGAEFAKFQRTLVDKYLAWQAAIVNEYRRKDQFVTQNFDLEWRGHSFGVQPDVNWEKAARCLTMAGVDIYHPSQDVLTGAEIAFGGDLARSLKRTNYLVMETQAQGYADWTPYPGQLKLCAYNNFASGANGVMYWHWHSIHNSVETYWKGLLSHDFQENDAYREACTVGGELRSIGKHLVNLKKKNDVAVLVSNESLTGLSWFGLEETAANNWALGYSGASYNDVVRWLYDALYRINVECDVVWPSSEFLPDYKVIVVPSLYAAPEDLLRRLERFVYDGGSVIATFKTGVADENLKVYPDALPHLLTDCFGMSYNQTTIPKNVKLAGAAVEAVCERDARTFMELLRPNGAQVLTTYEHPAWKKYAAITTNAYGRGKATYLGCMFSEGLLENILRSVLRDAGCHVPEETFPLILKTGKNDFGKRIQYVLNFSWDEVSVTNRFGDGTELLTGKAIRRDEQLDVGPWGVRILELA